MSFLSKSSSQGDSKGSKAPPSKGAEGTGSSFPSNSSKMENLVAERSEGNKASSDSQQPSSNNENPETDTEPTLSKSVDGKTTFKQKDLFGNISEEECQDSTIFESIKASSDSQQPSLNNENPDTDTEPALSQGVDGKTTFKPKDLLGNISEEECQDSTISESIKASSDSQQPSLKIENPQTDTEPALSQGVDGKTTFKPKDLLRNIFEEECQDRTISESSKASSNSQQPSLNNENPETHTEPALSQGVDVKITFKPKYLLKEESQHWTISKMDGTAELLKMCWLDVPGSIIATKGKAYEISFILSMNKDNFGWEDPVYVIARIGEEGKYTSVQIDLSKLGQEKEEFPKEKYCRVEFRRDENAGNNEKKLYFGLYEVWTNNWKGGLRIHEAIVRELTAEDSASTSKTSVHDSASTFTKYVGDVNGCRIS